MIGGFIVTGNASKRVVVRGIGPSLQGAGIQGVIPDPVLRLFRSNGTEFAFNDNWTDTQGADLQTIGLAPTHAFESAIVATLDPGAYTTIVSGKGGATGVGLVEVYDTNTASSAMLANISTRGAVKTGDNVMIGGFILGGSSTTPARVVVRAIGPTLAQSGVPNSLADPTLTSSTATARRSGLTTTGRIMPRRPRNCRPWRLRRRVWLNRRLSRPFHRAPTPRLSPENRAAPGLG